MNPLLSRGFIRQRSINVGLVRAGEDGDPPGAGVVGTGLIDVAPVRRDGDPVPARGSLADGAGTGGTGEAQAAAGRRPLGEAAVAVAAQDDDRVGAEAG